MSNDDSTKQQEVIIVGGGIAGLSCAVGLLQRGIRPLIIERRPYLGGRATTQPLDPPLDNSPHLITGAYRHLLQVMKLAGAPITFPETPMPVTWFDQAGVERQLATGSPLKTARSIVKMFGWSGIKSLTLIQQAVSPKTNFKTVGEWLSAKAFPAPIAGLLELLVVSTMNTRPDDADFQLFQVVIRETLLASSDASSFQRCSPLSRLLINPLRDYIERHGGKILLGQQVISITHGEIGWQVATRTQILPTNQVVLALPGHQRAQFLVEPEQIYSPILNVRFEITKHSPEWFGLSNNRIDWVFIDPHTPTVLEAVTSAASELAALPADEIFTTVQQIVGRIKPELKFIRPLGIVKEMRATPLQTPDWHRNRLTPATGEPQLWRAADDLATTYPATLESAAKAGLWAAKCVSGDLKGNSAESSINLLD